MILIRKYLTKAFLIFFFFIALVVISKKFIKNELQISGFTMGTTYIIKIISSKSTKEIKNIKKDIENILKNINQQMSTYIQSSELSNLNQESLKKEILISKELNHVLSIADKINSQTNGYFDVTIGKLVNLWGFGPNGEILIKPSQEDIDKASQHIGHDKFTLQNQYLIKKEDIYIDLSAIAKGFAVDEIANYLVESNFDNFLVEIGGEIKAKGKNKSNKNWKIAIESPNLQTIAKIITLENQAIATSGDYRNFFIDKNTKQKYSHTIDPILKKPKLDKLASVSVIHFDAIYADAYATALMAMGEDKAKKIAKKLNLKAILLVRNEKTFVQELINFE